jgi:hypothetical protein
MLGRHGLSETRMGFIDGCPACLSVFFTVQSACIGAGPRRIVQANGAIPAGMSRRVFVENKCAFAFPAVRSNAYRGIGNR